MEPLTILAAITGFLLLIKKPVEPQDLLNETAATDKISISPIEKITPVIIAVHPTVDSGTEGEAKIQEQLVEKRITPISTEPVNQIISRDNMTKRGGVIAL